MRKLPCVLIALLLLTGCGPSADDVKYDAAMSQQPTETPAQDEAPTETPAQAETPTETPAQDEAPTETPVQADEPETSNIPDGGESSQQPSSEGKVITITTYNSYQLKHLAKSYKKINPDVTVEIVEADMSPLMDFVNRTAVELLSGTSTDIIDVSHISYYKYAKSGLLCNFYEFMQSDDEFDKNDYYTNIFDALEYEGGLYALPRYFFYHTVSISNETDASTQAAFEALDVSVKERSTYTEKQK